MCIYIYNFSISISSIQGPMKPLNQDNFVEYPKGQPREVLQVLKPEVFALKILWPIGRLEDHKEAMQLSKKTSDKFVTLRVQGPK